MKNRITILGDFLAEITLDLQSIVAIEHFGRRIAVGDMVVAKGGPQVSRGSVGRVTIIKWIRGPRYGSDILGVCFAGMSVPIHVSFEDIDL